jgi:hypothetical protein
LTGVKCATFIKIVSISLKRLILKRKTHVKNKIAGKKNNRILSSERVLNENVIGMIKRFKIIGDRYRNRRKRFGLRFNLICAIYNFELE